MFRSALLVAVVLLSNSAPSISSQGRPGPAANIEDLAALAQQALNRGDYSTAAADYEEILKHDPDLPEIRANLGLTYHLMGQYEKATQAFESALSRNPKLYTANLFLGLDLLQLHRAEKALPYLRNATALQPGSGEAATALARDYEQMHDPAKAAYWFDHALQTEPQNIDAWYGMGIAYLELEKSVTEKLAAQDSKSPFRQLLLADSAADEGRSDQAIRIYKELLASHSSEPYLRSRLGFANLQRQDLVEAQQEFTEELARDPGSLSAQLGNARLASESGDVSGALRMIGRIAATDPGYFHAHIPGLWLGWDPERLNTFESALEHLPAAQAQPQTVSDLVAAIEQWKKEPLNSFAALPGEWKPLAQTKGSPSSSASAAKLATDGHYTACARALLSNLKALATGDLLLLSQCSYYAGGFQATLSATERLLTSSPENSAALFWEAKASGVLAIASLAQVGLRQPDSPRTHLLIGRAFEGQGYLNKARDEYQKVISVDPQNPAGHLALAELDVNNMNFDQALPELQTVLAHDPENPEASFLMSTILMFQHQYDRCLPYLKAALHGPPESLPRVHAFLGKVYASQGRTDDAIVELKNAAAADDDGSIHYQLFLLYKKVGDSAAAEAALRDSNAIRKANAINARERVGTQP